MRSDGCGLKVEGCGLVGMDSRRDRKRESKRARGGLGGGEGGERERRTKKDRERLDPRVQPLVISLCHLPAARNVRVSREKISLQLREI